MSKQTDLINIPDAITVSGSNVGIGTTSPLSTMHLSTTGGGSVYLQDSNATSTYNISEISNNAGNFGIQTRNSSGTFVSTDYQIVKNASGADYHRWFTQGTERMRIDSSGNVTVGKASVDTDTTGIELRANNLLASTRASAECLFLNRKTSDGDIAKFAREGTTVGSIGVEGADLTIGTGTNSGLQFFDGGSSVRPFNMASNSRVDNAIDLGESNTRFKDLYLSGGVYLGGTGSANKLEDYEEGTWTAVDGSGNAYSAGANATYTKIGRIVYINFDITATASTSGYQIVGLPFTASPTSVTANWSVYGGYSTSNADLWGHINASSNAIGMFVANGAHTLNGRWIGAGFYYTEQ